MPTASLRLPIAFIRDGLAFCSKANFYAGKTYCRLAVACQALSVAMCLGYIADAVARGDTALFSVFMGASLCCLFWLTAAARALGAIEFLDGYCAARESTGA